MERQSRSFSGPSRPLSCSPGISNMFLSLRPARDRRTIFTTQCTKLIFFCSKRSGNVWPLCTFILHLGNGDGLPRCRFLRCSAAVGGPTGDVMNLCLHAKSFRDQNLPPLPLVGCRCPADTGRDMLPAFSSFPSILSFLNEKRGKRRRQRHRRATRGCHLSSCGAHSSIHPSCANALITTNTARA